MTNRILASALLAAGLGLGAAAHADNRDFTLINDTPWQVDAVYVALPGAAYWGNDILGQGTLASGNSVEVQWPYGGISYTCRYDVMLAFHAHPPVEIHWNDINVCATTQVRVWYDFQRGAYQASWD